MTRKKRHKNIITKNSVILLFCLLKKTMTLKFLIFNFSFLILTACGVTKPVATTHTERIETHLQPIPIGADTIEIICSQQTITPSPLRGTPPINKGRVVKSTRGVNFSRHETDTTSTLRITLQPDTVFVPYINHIRSDTIVVHDRVCQQKLNHSNMTNLFLILILIAIFIIYLRKSIAHRQ